MPFPDFFPLLPSTVVPLPRRVFSFSNLEPERNRLATCMASEHIKKNECDSTGEKETRLRERANKEVRREGGRGEQKNKDGSW